MNLKHFSNIQLIYIALAIFFVIAFGIWGVLYPSFASRLHVMTERGSVEQEYLNLLMEDWRIVRPCAPIGYAADGVSEKSCPNGEDRVVVESACWFGVPGPRFQICYADPQSAEFGTGRPTLLPNKDE